MMGSPSTLNGQAGNGSISDQLDADVSRNDRQCQDERPEHPLDARRRARHHWLPETFVCVGHRSMNSVPHRKRAYMRQTGFGTDGRRSRDAGRNGRSSTFSVYVAGPHSARLSRSAMLRTNCGKFDPGNRFCGRLFIPGSNREAPRDFAESSAVGSRQKNAPAQVWETPGPVWSL